MSRVRSAEPAARIANSEPLPASRKVYLAGRSGIRVPMREIALQPTVGADGTITENAPLRVYDTSGPYTDPAVEIDLRRGLPELRRPWLRVRGDYDVVEPSYRPVPGHSDPDTPLPARRRALRGRGTVTQMHYARRGMVTEE